MSTSHNGNYAYSGTSVTIQITQDTPTVTTWPTYTGKTYKNLIDLSKISTTGVASVDGAFEFTGVSIDAGVATFTIVFTPTSSNYKSVSKTDYTVNLTAVATYNSTNYYTIFDAVTAANDSTGGGTVWVIPNTSGDVIIDTDLTIDSDVTLILPYGTTDDANGRNTSTTATIVGGYSLSELKERMTLVKLSAGKTITLNGILEISGQLAGGSGGTPYAGHTEGLYAELVLGSNSKIEIPTGSKDAVINCYGFITEESKNNGSQVILNAGSIYQPFVFLDFGGGTYMKTVYDKKNTLSQAPFSEFVLMNVRPEMTIYHAASLYGWANLYAGGKHNPATLSVIGNGSAALLELTDSTYSKVVAKYDHDKLLAQSGNPCKLDIYGGARLNEIKMTLILGEVLGVDLGSIDVNTSEYYFPISWVFDISLNQANDQTAIAKYQINYPTKLMHGARLTVNENTEFTAGNFAVYDSIHNLPTGDPNPCPITSEAVFVVNGSLVATNFAGKIYSNNHGATVSISESPTLTLFECVYYTTTSTILGKTTTTGHIDTWHSNIINTSLCYFESYDADGNMVSVSAPVGITTSGRSAKVYNGKWILDQVTLEFVTNGGNACDDIVVKYDEVKEAYVVSKLPTPTHERSDKIFDGWYLDNTTFSVGFGSITSATNYDVLSSDVIKIYAKWITEIKPVSSYVAVTLPDLPDGAYITCEAYYADANGNAILYEGGFDTRNYSGVKVIYVESGTTLVYHMKSYHILGTDTLPKFTTGYVEGVNNITNGSDKTQNVTINGSEGSSCTATSIVVLARITFDTTSLAAGDYHSVTVQYNANGTVTITSKVSGGTYGLGTYGYYKNSVRLTENGTTLTEQGYSGRISTSAQITWTSTAGTVYTKLKLLNY